METGANQPGTTPDKRQTYVCTTLAEVDEIVQEHAETTVADYCQTHVDQGRNYGKDWEPDEDFKLLSWTRWGHPGFPEDGVPFVYVPGGRLKIPCRPDADDTDEKPEEQKDDSVEAEKMETDTDDVKPEEKQTDDSGEDEKQGTDTDDTKPGEKQEQEDDPDNVEKEQEEKQEKQDDVDSAVKTDGENKENVEEQKQDDPENTQKYDGPLFVSITEALKFPDYKTDDGCMPGKKKKKTIKARINEAVEVSIDSLVRERIFYVRLLYDNDLKGRAPPQQTEEVAQAPAEKVDYHENVGPASQWQEYRREEYPNRSYYRPDRNGRYSRDSRDGDSRYGRDSDRDSDRRSHRDSDRSSRDRSDRDRQDRRGSDRKSRERSRRDSNSPEVTFDKKLSLDDMAELHKQRKSKREKEEGRDSRESRDRKKHEKHSHRPPIEPPKFDKGLSLDDMAELWRKRKLERENKTEDTGEPSPKVKKGDEGTQETPIEIDDDNGNKDKDPEAKSAEAVDEGAEAKSSEAVDEGAEAKSLQEGAARIKFNTEWKGTIEDFLAEHPSAQWNSLSLRQSIAVAAELLEEAGMTPVLPDGKVGGNVAAVLDVDEKPVVLVTKSGKAANTKLDIDKDVCFITKFDPKTWKVEYLAHDSSVQPSSDTPLHYSVLNPIQDLGWSEKPTVVLHGHALATEEEAKRFNIPISMEETLFSTSEDVESLKKLVHSHPYPKDKVFIRKGHGFVILGKDMADALDTFQKRVQNPEN